MQQDQQPAATDGLHRRVPADPEAGRPADRQHLQVKLHELFGLYMQKLSRAGLKSDQTCAADSLIAISASILILFCGLSQTQEDKVRGHVYNV